MTANKTPRVAVIGAANIDLIASPSGRYVPRDSNPGRVNMSFGGVGRNVAHNLRLLGCDVRFATVFGDDDFADGLRKNCDEIGLNTSLCERVRGALSSVYVCINDENGDLVSAVSQMELMDSLTPSFIEARMDAFNACDAVVVETNVPSESIAALLDGCRVPVFADTVSTAKAQRILAAFDGTRRLHTLKMNRLEAEELTGVDISGLSDLKPATAALHDMGVDHIFITMGSMGVYYHDADSGIQWPTTPVKMVSSTGAGDAFLAGVVYARCLGKGPQDAIRCALRASALTVQCEGAVNQSLTAEYVLSDE